MADSGLRSFKISCVESFAIAALCGILGFNPELPKNSNAAVRNESPNGIYMYARHLPSLDPFAPSVESTGQSPREVGLSVDSGVLTRATAREHAASAASTTGT